MIIEALISIDIDFDPDGKFDFYSLNYSNYTDDQWLEIKLRPDDKSIICQSSHFDWSIPPVCSHLQIRKLKPKKNSRDTKYPFFDVSHRESWNSAS